MPKFFALFLTFAVLASCKKTENQSEVTVQEHTTATDNATVSEDDIRPTLTGEAGFIADSVIMIRFAEFSLRIEHLELSEGEKEIRAENDTVVIAPDLAWSIEGQLISLLEGVSDAKVEQRSQTSVSISNEGPHCDLTDWKHYESPWKPLSKNAKGQFICHKYSTADSERFPKIAIDELKKQVKETCGDDYYKLVENIKSPNEQPSAVSISHYYLRISGRDADGKQFIKVIIIEQPMGC